MLLRRVVPPLLLAVATSGDTRCFTEDACASGSKSLDFESCDIEDGDANDLAACFDDVGRSNIEVLNLNKNDLTTLPLDLFDGFEVLANLTLEFNDLTLQAGNFKGATALDTLKLCWNEVDTLPSGVFEGLESLRELDLTGNPLVPLAGDFMDAASLHILTLDQIILEDVPSGLFDGLSSLQGLNIRNNDFTTLPADVFDNLLSLKELSLGANLLTALPADIFASLESLEFLFLSFNQITSLPTGVFGGLTSLNQLFLGNNQLTIVQDGIFAGLTSLLELNLWSNKITTVESGVFSELTSLLKLDLQSNDLVTLPTGAFGGLSSLVELKLGYNDISTLPAGIFGDLTSLVELTLLRNEIAALPAGVFDGLASLTSMSLSNNDLTTLESGIFEGMSALESLDLSYNALSTLPSGAFDAMGDSLTELRLHVNDLISLPEGIFDGLSSLLSLELDHNNLRSLSADVFNGAPSLQTLELDWNELSALPANIFYGIPNLLSLDINNNWFANFPTGIFDGLTSLLTLEMSDNNNITTLPAGLFDGLVSLTSLDLDDIDNLQCVPETNAEDVGLPFPFDESSICECPADPTCDEGGAACECQPGINGYSCVGSSADVIRAFSCRASVDCSSDGDCASDEVCCPTTQTCEPLIGSSSSACGDPHMTGFRGQKFDFTGEDNAWYSLISDLPSLHLNMRVTAPLPDLPDITYITGISLIAADEDGIEHSIAISVNNPHSLDSSCPSWMPSCLADGALSVVVDGEKSLAAPGTEVPGLGMKISAVNLPGACRSFGFEKYWERKMLEQVRVGQASEFWSHNTAESTDHDAFVTDTQDMSEWILGDPTATNMMECAAYVAGSANVDGGIFHHQSEHASFKVSTPHATIRVSHGRLHQVRMRDLADRYDLPDHLTWQMNLAIDQRGISQHATGILGETFIATVDDSGNAIMNGMEAIRGTQETYRVAGPFEIEFAGNSYGT